MGKLYKFAVGMFVGWVWCTLVMGGIWYFAPSMKYNMIVLTLMFSMVLYSGILAIFPVFPGSKIGKGKRAKDVIKNRHKEHKPGNVMGIKPSGPVFRSPGHSTPHGNDFRRPTSPDMFFED